MRASRQASRRLVLVNRYFHPDHSATSQLATDLAVHCAACGYEVTVVSSRQRYDDPAAELPRKGSVGDIEVHRAWSTRFGRDSLFTRAFDYLTFAVSAFVLLVRHARRRSVVIAMTDPPMLSVVAAAASALRRATLLNWLQDVFPEVAESLGVTRRSSLLRAVRDWSLRRAATNIAVGELMAERIRDRGIRTVVVHNWADDGIEPVPAGDNPLRAEWGLTDRFVVVYSGNLGRAHEVETIAGAIRALAGDSRIHFLFIGGGARTEELRRGTAGLPNVSFRPYQPRERLRESLSVADVHLISLDPRAEGLIVPSKLYGVLAAGRPAIFIGAAAGETGTLLRAIGCGETVGPADVAGLVSQIRRLASDARLCATMGARAREAHEARFAPEKALAAWMRVIDSQAALDRRSPLEETAAGA